VRVAVRHPDQASFLARACKTEQITTAYADVWNEPSVGQAVNGAQAVVNTVGHYVEQGKATFEAIYAQGALHVARASATAGMRRLVHISGIGAEPTSVSPYVRARKHWRTSGQRSISRSHNPPPERHVWGLRTNSSIGWLL
jgi:uncharacterized protein YbjT (DUF2867 family)